MTSIIDDAKERMLRTAIANATPKIPQLTMLRTGEPGTGRDDVVT
jgi:hypothetical protein